MVSWSARGTRMTRCARGSGWARRTSWPRIACESYSSCYSRLDIICFVLGRIVLATSRT